MKKILIVEDNKSTAEMMAAQLQGAGYETRMTPDAMLGRSEAGRWKPDLVLLDLMIPAGGGVGVLRNMKQSIQTKTIPVLVVTSSTDPAMRKQILELGVKIVIQKPYKLEDLLSNVERMLATEKDTLGQNPNR